MSALPEIPRELVDNWRQWWPADAAAVADDVRARLADAVAAWHLDDLRLLSGGNVALVLAARRDGREVVVKVSPAIEAAALSGEAAALERWARAGIAPGVWAVRDAGLTLLLARVRPGTSLADAGATAEEILDVIGGLCPQLHLEVEADAFGSLADHAAREGWLTALAGRREHDELRALLGPAAGDRLLHTDLHWLNVLRDSARWVVIDPKPHLGDPHAEAFAFLAGPPVREIPAARPVARAHVRRLAATYATAAGLDVDRLLAWVRLRALVIVADPVVARSPWGRRLSRLIDAVA